MQAVILAGGKGTRLKPFTNAIPKPLVPVGDLPILEIVLRQLKARGFTRVVLAVNHLARLIQAFFGDGSSLGLDIVYSLEDKVLGTAGPLGLIPDLDDDFLVMNGDLLTTLPFDDLMRRHLEGGAMATITAYRREVKIDLGVLEISDGKFERYIEKPTYHFNVSMGIYALKREALRFVPSGEKFDMPDLITCLHDSGKMIDCYEAECEWLDIGRPEDYEVAVSLFEANRGRYLPA
jgi:NDP-sugar pyrophosphorylase family protein